MSSSLGALECIYSVSLGLSLMDAFLEFHFSRSPTYVFLVILTELIEHEAWPPNLKILGSFSTVH